MIGNRNSVCPWGFVFSNDSGNRFINVSYLIEAVWGLKTRIIYYNILHGNIEKQLPKQTVLHVPLYN